MWFEKGYQRERISNGEMDVSQFLSSDNAVVGAVKKSFLTFDMPGNFEEKIAEVKDKVDSLIEHQENDIAFKSPYKKKTTQRNLDLFDK